MLQSETAFRSMGIEVFCTSRGHPKSPERPPQNRRFLAPAGEPKLHSGYPASWGSLRINCSLREGVHRSRKDDPCVPFQIIRWSLFRRPSNCFNSWREFRQLLLSTGRLGICTESSIRF